MGFSHLLVVTSKKVEKRIKKLFHRSSMICRHHADHEINSFNQNIVQFLLFRLTSSNFILILSSCQLLSPLLMLQYHSAFENCIQLVSLTLLAIPINLTPNEKEGKKKLNANTLPLIWMYLNYCKSVRSNCSYEHDWYWTLPVGWDNKLQSDSDPHAYERM